MHYWLILTNMGRGGQFSKKFPTNYANGTNFIGERFLITLIFLKVFYRNFLKLFEFYEFAISLADKIRKIRNFNKKRSFLLKFFVKLKLSVDKKLVKFVQFVVYSFDVLENWPALPLRGRLRNMSQITDVTQQFLCPR